MAAHWCGGAGPLGTFIRPHRKEEIMAKEKLVEAITSMSEDFAQWYTDVVTKAERKVQSCRSGKRIYAYVYS